MVLLKFLILVGLNLSSANLLYESDGDLNLGLIVDDCLHNTSAKRTLVNSAIWTINRLNAVKIAEPLSIGFSVYNVCSDSDYFNAIFKMYQEKDDRYLLGYVMIQDPPERVFEFLQVLNIHFKVSTKFILNLIKATVKVLEALNWIDNITVVAPNQSILREFYRFTRRDWICINNFIIYEENIKLTNVNIDPNQRIIILGQSQDILTFVRHFNLSTANETNIILVPFDGAEINGAPDGSYIIQPLYTDSPQYIKPQKILPTPLLFEIANPIISFTKNLAKHLRENCNDTNYKLNCLTNTLKPQIEYHVIKPEGILKALKIEPLSQEFVYNVYHVENVTYSKLETNISDFEYLKAVGLQNYVKTFTFNVVDENLTILDSFEKENGTVVGCFKELEHCILECQNFKSFESTKLYTFHNTNIILRPEPWVYAFISLSALGAIFSLSILVFISTRLCRKYVLEGNPILTILLLLAVFVMFCSIIPFSLEGNKYTRSAIYLARALCVTLPYTFTFSLLLSRTILLATVCREVGFMSHVAGSVQSFLALFMFAVQLALTIQLTGNCEEIFRGNVLVYLSSYNVILLALLLFITPLITKSQRNYREGKYFTISIVLLSCTWSCWLPGYAVLGESWKDPMLCLGLVSTASILLGSIFIPRTYLMTVSAARERFTSALPSLATATSAMDIYRASTQPVYDCVNVAAINAASTLRSHSIPYPPPADFYSSPDMPEEEDEEFDVNRCETPPPDKVTRF